MSQKSLRGIATLYTGHMAGTIDLAALPLWIGVLMANYGLAPQQAGLTVTMFLAGIVVASAVLAPRFDRLRPRWIATLGYFAAAVCFLLSLLLPVAPGSFQSLLVIHAIAGLCVGSGLSMVHGSIGRTQNPHRHFGFANVMVGIMAIFMFAILPGQITLHGGQAMFVAFIIVMTMTGSAALLFYPESSANAEVASVASKQSRAPIPAIAYLLVVAVVCLMLNHSMVFAFVERISASRGFDSGQVQLLLIAMGFFNLLPGLLAVLLQKRFSPLAVGMAGGLLQAALALTLTSATTFTFFGAATFFYPATILFIHTFLFGILSQVDPSGRVVAATPAMMMTGAALGPAIGGGLVAAIGFEGLGWAAFAFAAAATTLLIIVQQGISKRVVPAQAV